MSTPLNIHFATVTGNAEALADRAGKRAPGEGFAPKVTNLSKIVPADLVRQDFAIFIVSTWGDGDAPDDAMDFWNDLDSAKAPELPGLRYAVFGLGDRSYPEYNAFARKLDDRLAALGARRLEDRFEADADYEDDYQAWERRIFRILGVLRTRESVNA